MAGSIEGDVQYLGLLVSGLIVLIVGLVMHSFIIGVNVTDWWKGRSVTPVDHIVTSLGMSRMGAQCAASLYLFLENFKIYVTLVLIDTFTTFFSYANFWLTCLLSIVLCLKISNLRSRLFLYLRGMISHRTGYCIGASLLISAISCLMPSYTAITELNKGETYNKSINSLLTDCIYRNFIYIYTIGSLFPLFFYSISSVLLSTSLYDHITKMKKSSNLSINLETYYSVLKFVSFTFIYNTIYVIGQFLRVFYYYLYCVDLDWLYIVLDFLLVLHSSYLIYRTARLRSQMSKVLQNVTNFLFQRKDTETGENIEMHHF